MRVLDLGSCYQVGLSASEVADWNRRWPCSTLVGRQVFYFEKGTGDLVDRSGRGDGAEAEAVAMASDAQKCGKRVLGLA